MALHGRVLVNGSTLAAWSAQRLDAEIRDVNTYRCRVLAHGAGSG